MTSHIPTATPAIGNLCPVIAATLQHIGSYSMGAMAQSAMRGRVPALLLALLGLLAVVPAARLDTHSFEAPFQETDASGNRIVDRHWRSAGTTVVNPHFIRLTPDRQSRKGAVWSRKALGVDSFSSLLKFRISGQGKNFFGDGLAIWIVQQGYYVEGNLHGFVDRFTGVGIIFDTFKNTENLAAHRDVTILVNDGTKTVDQMLAGNNVLGCDANVRYHSERADFKVTDQSRAKIVVEDTKLIVMVDARNTGEWVECAKVDLELPSGWSKRAHIGLTASTGQLADNHDVLALLTHSDATGLDMEEELIAAKKKFTLDADASNEENVKHIANTLNDLMDTIDLLHHHLELEMAEVDDHIKSMIQKLQAKGEKSEDRLDNLEEMISATVQGTIEDRLRKLENQLKGQINQKVTRVERQIEKDMDKLEKMGSSAGSWKVPFFLMLLVMVAAGIGMYMFYRRMMKIHLL